jgi:rSAM/selenodomain-associated transferase 2
MDSSPDETHDPVVSIVIPTLDEGDRIGATLESLGRLRTVVGVEILLVDGGSRDETVAIAERQRARVLSAERGRGAQLHAGACAARGVVLWFLHADTHPPSDGLERIMEALEDERVVAGNFGLSFDAGGRAARFLTWLYPRLRWLGIRYGDSTLFVRREAYLQSGGFRPLPIFEDLDLLPRLRRLGRFASVPSPVITSARNFEGRSFAAVFARWTALQVLYWLGISPRVLGRFYGRARGAPEASPTVPGNEGSDERQSTRSGPPSPCPSARCAGGSASAASSSPASPDSRSEPSPTRRAASR